MEQALSIFSRRHIFALVFFGVLLFLLYQLALMFRPFLLAMVWAAILAHLMFPLHQRLTAKLGGRVSWSAALLTVVILMVGVLPLIWTGVIIVREAAFLEVEVGEWVKSGGLERLPQELEQLPIIGTPLGYAVDRLGRDVDGNLGDILISSANTVSQFLVGGLAGFVKNVVGFVVNALLMIVTLFFFFRDGRELVSGLYELVPLDASHKHKIFTRLDQTMRAVVKGVVVTAVVQGLLAGVAYVALGVPMPVGLTALTTVLAPLPFGGTALVWVPLGLWLLWVGPTWKAVALFLWGVGVVSTVDQFLRPMLIGQEAKIPVFLLMFSVIGGLSVYGIIGVFIGPIVVALLLTALQIYREEYQSPAPESPSSSAPPALS